MTLRFIGTVRMEVGDYRVPAMEVVNDDIYQAAVAIKEIYEANPCTDPAQGDPRTLFLSAIDGDGTTIGEFNFDTLEVVSGFSGQGEM